MKTLPFTKNQIEELIGAHPTPLYIYDEAGIRRQTNRLSNAFSWNKGFKQHFAVKALPNPEILKIVKEEGSGLDCSSLPELILADRVGISGGEIIFSSNDTPAEEFVEAKKRGALINLDDPNHLDFLEKAAGLPDIICFRYTPISLRTGNAIIGDAKERKFGMTREQLFEVYHRAKEKGIRRFGLHSMPVSNELNVEFLLEAARELLSTAKEIQDTLDITFEFINLGGGIGIPYRPEDREFDIEAFGKGVKETAEKTFGSAIPALHMECGRYITGPHGYLISRVRHVKSSYKKYVGLDATMADLMRPGMYGAYHHVTVLGKENAAQNETYDVVGSLCENNDKFAIDRKLPLIEPDDLVVIHDTGAHAHAMGFNYNGKLRSAEFLLRHAGASGEGGQGPEFKMIRRAETVDDYFATLKF
ncbi:diaminopimelate decarboxylase [Candidatus Kaiserbacteria bacterium RIFCSPLOWO2_12_FULL_53_8]|uniref:Diaminopimelate decarboxylase n=2 Tax=Candidatus Kaiseribacteriota TaxID=1752734 RepID=A0A1F6CVH6_9BACT|nr:MAG: diaminopimelate decarboxylase [Candidatus Kaiserbacteria bacterium RIFCSPHIGHO2_01_FULL_53_29]OGG92337.1 MAG: diaminopimelate decarboxylase [Candidatus Kaiserbacteria bacterium RIFCSPLOWO2_12_FULL_53_8]